MSSTVQGPRTPPTTPDVDRPHFDFRLERLRGIRAHAEDAAKEELAASLQHRLKGEAMLRAAVDGVDGARDHCRSATGGPVSGDDLFAAQTYLERAERARDAAAEDLSRRETEVAARRAELEERARDRQALERLKERRRSEWQLEVNRREGAVLDELAVVRHRRQKEGR